MEENWKKYSTYKIEVDPDQDDKAKEILLCSFARPHMRAFHCAWWSFFIAFFIWFAITPLLPSIRDDLGLTKKEIWTSSIAAVGTTILVRFLLGPLCDIYGPRVLFSIILCAASIPTACTGLINSAKDLVVVRSFIGIAGGTFVMSQYWPSRMFSKEVVGTANALVGGWGNLGAGITNLIIGAYLYPLFEMMIGDTEGAWRTICIVPAFFAFLTGVVVYFISDDSPKGNYHELKEHKVFNKTHSATVFSSFSRASMNRNSWLLFIQYACSFGVELTMNNAAALYFRDEFGLSKEASGSIASIFGWMNLFARGLGGFVSDSWNYHWGLRGRIWIQTLCMLAEGVLVLIFSNTSSLAASVATLVFFSLFVQAAEGTCYAIVPYVDPLHMGSVCGIVGAGGNVGAVVFGLGFRELNYSKAFGIMGCSILGSSLLSIFISIEGHAGMFGGKDQRVDPETGRVMDTMDDSDGYRVALGEKALLVKGHAEEESSMYQA